MGQKKNKWRRDKNASGSERSEQPRRRRWGSGGGSAATTDGEDDPESYTKTSGRNRNKRGSGKLRGRGNDGDPVVNGKQATAHRRNDEDKSPPKVSEGEENPHTSEHLAEAEPSRVQPECGQSLLASTRDTDAELARLPPQEETCALSKDHRQQAEQTHAAVPEGAMTRNGEDEDEGKAGTKKTQESGASAVSAREGTPVDRPVTQVDGTSTLQSCNDASDDALCCEARNNGPRSVSSPCSAKLSLPANAEVVVPALALGKSSQSNRETLVGTSDRRGTAESIMDDTPYSLAWAGGRKGRSLMKTVENVLSGWLCTQNAKGKCVEAELAAVMKDIGSNSTSLGRLARKLDVPGSVICALGLRFRGREWGDLQNKIAAARDFLDLEAESKCSAALTEFGSEVSAPRSIDEIPLDAVAALAREEAAGFELAELEVRQALRAEASRIAPRASPSAARTLFQRLDPAATGVVAAPELASLALHLLRLSPTGSAEYSLSLSRARNTVKIGLSPATPGAGITSDAPRGMDTLSGKGGRRPTTTGCVTPGWGDDSCALARSRIRRVRGVIERLARAAAAAASFPTKSENNRNAGGDFGHEQHYRGQHEAARRTSTAKEEEPRGRTQPVGAPPVRHPSSRAQASTAQRGDDEADSCGRSLITLSKFCRFMEGKKFDGAGSLEGFLRTLSRAGRSLPPAAESDTVAQRARFVPDQASYTTETGRRNALPVEEGARGTTSTARWGTRGVRRASSQFNHRASLTNRSRFDSAAAVIAVGEKSAEMIARVRQDGCGDIRNSARSGGREEPYSTPPSGGLALSGRRGGDFLAQALSSFDSDGSLTLSAGELISAASQVAGLVTPMRQEWGDVLTKRFARGAKEGVGLGGGAASCRRGCSGPAGGGRAGSVRWLGQDVEGSANSRLDIATLVDFLRPKAFSLSVMTPFGLVELSLDDPCLTLGGLRDIVVKKMFWRQHNCEVRRSDRDNFTLSRYYGALPLDTESAGQRRRLVLDVLRPGELIFVTDRPASQSRVEEPQIPGFEYMMGARRHRSRADERSAPNKGTGRAGKAPTGGALPRGRQSSSTAAGRTATNVGGPPRRFSAPTPSGPSSPQSPQALVERAVPSPPSVSYIRNEINSINRGSIPSGALSKTATGEGPASIREPSETLAQSPANDRSTQGAGAIKPTGDRTGKALCVERREKRAIRRLIHYRREVSYTGSKDYPGRREAARPSSLIFDWDVDVVERWISETLELGHCREAFRAEKA
ncbi:unnamed protein product, partial [Scytosiphon promiscuus]